MTKTNIALGVAALAVGVAILPKLALAYRESGGAYGPKHTEERHAAMVKAFDSGDYKAWKSQMNGQGRVSEVVNEGSFAKFARMRKLQLDGKTAEANQLRVELGLGQGGGRHQGNGAGRYQK